MTTDADKTRPAAISDDTLREALAVANLPTLLMVLVQITGDMKWLEDPYTPTRPRGLSDNDSAGLSIELQQQVRDAAFDAISGWLRDGHCAIPEVSEDLAVRMLSRSMGDSIPSAYGPLLRSELSPQSVDPRVAAETFSDAASDYSVVIVGAGVSGVAAALLLKSAGFDVTVLEKSGSVGGVYVENHYPNVAVDTPSHLYSFLWARYDWSRYFAEGGEVLSYFEHIARDFGVEENIQFNTSVLRTVYDATTCRWTTTARRSDGTTFTIESNFVVSAVGAFNPPKYPHIEGADLFTGESFHTATFPEVDLSGKRVAVIGNGATAMQLVPAIAPDVEHLVVFQRQPQWAAPFEKFQQPVPPALRALFQAVPLYDLWYRIRLSWLYMDRLYDSLQRDPDWPHPDRSMNSINDRHREFFTEYIRSELQGDEKLIAQLTPTYPPFGKRILLDNGWYRTMLRDNVTVVSGGAARMDEKAVYTTDGQRHEVDVVIYATGFHAERFLSSFEVIGPDGASLADTWNGDDARAYLGTVVRDLPNFVCLYGPNAMIGHGGSLITIAQFQLDYCADLLRQVVARGDAAFEIRREVHDTYNETVDAMHDNMVWTHPGMSTYYRNSKGRVVVVNPWRVLDYYRMTRQADLSEYVLTARAREAVEAAAGPVG